MDVQWLKVLHEGHGEEGVLNVLERSREGDEDFGGEVPVLNDETTDGGFGAEFVEFVELGLNSTIVDNYGLAESW